VARAGAARALAHNTAREIEAREAMLRDVVAETRTSISWRLTAPLRLFRRPRPADRLRLGPDPTPTTQAGRPR
jgi:hypothetical protein